jgi:hypothetical protein
MRRTLIFLLCLGIPAQAFANCTSRVDEAAFGKSTATATSDLDGASSMFFECVNDELAFGLFVLSKNEENLSGQATVKVMVDDEPAEDFEVSMGSTVSGHLRFTNEDPKVAASLARRVMAAKKTVDTGVVQKDGKIWLATKRRTKGSTKAIAAVLKACKIETADSPTDAKK